MIKDIIIRSKPCYVFFQVFSKTKPEIALNITRRTGITHSHVWKLLNKFCDEGLISMEKQGRIKILALTKKGLEIGTYLKAIHKILDKIDKNKLICH